MKTEQTFQKETEEEQEFIILPIKPSNNDFNQLSLVKDEGIIVLTNNTYDPFGQRLRKTEYDSCFSTNTYYLDNFIQKVNSTGTYNETYYYYNGLLVGKKDNSGKILFYHPNHLGSTTLITNSSGQVAEDLMYKPFGSTNNTAQRYTYTGHEQDNEAGGLIYAGARYYNPETGQFLQADPVIGDMYNPQDLNKYSYVRNNPYKYVDPNGELGWDTLLGGLFGSLIIGDYTFVTEMNKVGWDQSKVDKGKVLSSFGSGFVAGATFTATLGLASTTIIGSSILSIMGPVNYAGTSGIISGIAGNTINNIMTGQNPFNNIGKNLGGDFIGGIIGGTGFGIYKNNELISPREIKPIYTSGSATHVEPAHVNPNIQLGRSKFIEGIDMQSFANEVVGKGRLTTQENGLLRYDADLSRVVGTRGETGGRVILNPKTGEVITQFPQFVN